VLDRSFGAGGKVTTDVTGSTDGANAPVVQADGRLVAAGWSLADFGLARYHPDGRLDTSFGIGGIVTTDVGDPDEASALVVQPDGKLVAAGSAATFQGEMADFALVRYHRDGSLDPSFGTGGIVKTDFGADEGVGALILQADGKLVAAGASTNETRVGPSTRAFALARYHRNGRLDTSFGTGGKVVTTFPGTASAGALVGQPDGRLVAAGSARIDDADFALARYNRDGSLDQRFGVGGRVITDFEGGSDDASTLVFQGGKLVAGGSAYVFLGDRTDFAMVRYNRDGSLDPRFGVNGKVTTTFEPTTDFSSHHMTALVSQGDGLVAAGSVTAGTDQDLTVDFALARYHRDGTLDTRFGADGRVVTDFGGVDEANALAVQADGKVVAAGSAESGDTFADFALARYKTNDVDGQCRTSWNVPRLAPALPSTPREQARI
jgi:uncharacterized delta-60 repeat protein